MSLFSHFANPGFAKRAIAAHRKETAAMGTSPVGKSATHPASLKRANTSSKPRAATFAPGSFVHLLTGARDREAANPASEQSDDWNRTPGEQRGVAFAAMVERAAAVRDGRDPLPRIEAPRQGVRRVRGAELVGAMRAIGGLKESER